MKEAQEATQPTIAKVQASAATTYENNIKPAVEKAKVSLDVAGKAIKESSTKIIEGVSKTLNQDGQNASSQASATSSSAPAPLMRQFTGTSADEGSGQ